PPARGSRSANLHVHSDDPVTPDFIVPLDGVGGAGVMVITTPASGAIDFGSILVQQTSSPASIVIENQGEVSLTISTITTAPAQFARGGRAPPITLGPHGTATWSMTCTPSSATTFMGATTFTSDALANPTQMVSLSCTGVNGSLTAMPAPAAF